jgi:hypothetical protein
MALDYRPGGAAGGNTKSAPHDLSAPRSGFAQPHKNIQHTVRYTELAPDRFRDFWR